MRRGAAVGVERGADRLLFLVAREGSAVGAEALRATVGEVVDHGEEGEWRVESGEWRVKKRAEQMAVSTVGGTGVTRTTRATRASGDEGGWGRGYK
jgi:hypothetical protein